MALSRALRQVAEPLEHVAVVLAANPDGLIRGTRANANGVDLNRNVPTSTWRADSVTSRATIGDPSDVRLSPGTHPASEPETRALLALIDELTPAVAVALHAPLACIDDANKACLVPDSLCVRGCPSCATLGTLPKGRLERGGRSTDLP